MYLAKENAPTIMVRMMPNTFMCGLLSGEE